MTLSLLCSSKENLFYTNLLYFCNAISQDKERFLMLINERVRNCILVITSIITKRIWQTHNERVKHVIKVDFLILILMAKDEIVISAIILSISLEFFLNVFLISEYLF